MSAEEAREQACGRCQQSDSGSRWPPVKEQGQWMCTCAGQSRRGVDWRRDGEGEGARGAAYGGGTTGLSAGAPTPRR